ncbi:MAG TPA: arginine deiminase-related protein [Oligoflexia bacterium]|nr:arginine deiminase-related protein [Oligoflexia bacterium]HMR25527.1 arginine deiminase-related protein [Oligoflexia bacterium]
MKKVICNIEDKTTAEKREIPLSNVIMCPPTYFKIIDVKNIHMQGQIGNVDHDKALAQWNAMKQAVIDEGYVVYEIDPVENLEDMVFAANPAFVGRNSQGEKIVLLSNMKHASRKKEVSSYAQWFEEHGYQVKNLPNADYNFEGNGDALWHPQKHLIWGGYGFRTEWEVYDEISKIYDAPVCRVNLQKPHFYHLDTCFCPLNSESILYYPEAFDQAGIDLIKYYFKDPIEVDQDEAQQNFACNSMVLGKSVFIQKGSPKTVAALKERNFKVIELDTSEFMKSGGSVFCMKLQVY